MSAPRSVYSHRISPAEAHRSHIPIGTISSLTTSPPLPAPPQDTAGRERALSCAVLLASRFAGLADRLSLLDKAVTRPAPIEEALPGNRVIRQFGQRFVVQRFQLLHHIRGEDGVE